MQIEQIKTDELLPYARNSRTHSSDQVAQIAASIKEFGFTNPILIDDDNSIIAGHGRVMAARRLHLKDVPCIRLSHLNESQKRAYVIADNKLALNAGWDDEMLKIEISDLHESSFDTELLGFSTEEIKAMLDDADANFAPAKEDDQGTLDELDPKWIACPNCGKEFDARKA